MFEIMLQIPTFGPNPRSSQNTRWLFPSYVTVLCTRQIVHVLTFTLTYHQMPPTVSQINTIGQLKRHRVAIDLDPKDWRFIPDLLKSISREIDLIINGGPRSIVYHDCTGEVGVPWYRNGDGRCAFVNVF